MIRRGICISTLSVCLFCLTGALNVFATQGDPAFLEMDYLQGLPAAAMKAAEGGELASMEGAARLMVGNFAVIPNAEGRLLLPAGSVCDSVEVADGWMRVRVSLPETLDELGISESTVETAGAILRYHFAEPERLTEIRLLGRKGAQGPWLPLDEFVPPVPPETFGNEDWYEPDGPGPQPAPNYQKLYSRGGASPGATTNNVTGQGPLGTSGQPQGALSGRTVYFSAGHGWYWYAAGSRWSLMRPRLLQMNEDHGNIDQILFFAHYLFNAGATVVPMRPLGHQENEVVLDNTSAGVSWSGTWNDSVNPRYYGPGSPPYRWTDASSSQTATATYTPNIPEAGFYPVYCWANYGSDRVPDQLYQVRHTAGTAEVRINHRRVGCGWIWLGTYYFESGSHPSTGSVVISNQSSSSGVVIADAIRFGNGEGDVDRGGGISGYLRETECSRYWVQRGLGEGGSSSVYDGSGDDNSDNVGTPPRMAAQMRRDDGQGYNGDIYLGFHSNASSNTSARGCVALITDYGGTPVNQAAFATLVADELDADALIEDGNWEHAWLDRSSPTYTSGYGEINSSNLNNEMCGTIIEVAFHSNAQDAELMRDPKVREVFARSCYQGIARYFHQFDSNPLSFLPEPPVRVRAFNNGSGGVTLGWAASPAGGAGGDAATGYVVYRSSDGLNFGNPVTTTGTSTTINGLTAGQTYYFRVAATNAGGESLPSEVLAVRVRSLGTSPILIVNGYDRIDRYNNVTEDRPPMSDVDRLHLRLNNSYDYVRTAAEDIDAYGEDFDSCSNEAVEAGDISLGSYAAVVCLLGEEAVSDETFSAAEQSAVQTYLSGGGNLFVSGAEIGWDLDRPSGPSSTDRAFYNTYLRASYVADDAGTYLAAGAAGSIFEGLTLTFDNGSQIYNVDYPDVIAPAGGSTVAMHYASGTGTSIDNFESIGGWRDPNYAGQTNADDASTFTIASSPTYEGSGSGDLYYVWETGNFIREYNSTQPQFPVSATFSIWVYGDNSGHEVRIALRDSDVEIYVNDYLTIDFTGWRQIVWPDVQNNPGTRWYDPGGDGVITGPNIAFDSIQVNKVSGVNSGHLYFDEASYSTGGGGTSTAGVQYSGAYKLVHLGFPYEAITSSAVRAEVMEAVLDFFGFGSDVSYWELY